MKINKLIPVVLLISVFFLVGCQEQGEETPTQEKAEVKVTTQPAEKVSLQSEADMAAFQGAMELKDETFCDRISDNEYKKECKTSLSDKKTHEEALANIDAALCDKMSTEDKQKACKTEIEVIKKGKEKSAEELATIEKNAAQFSSITEKEDTTACAELNDPTLKESCEIKILTNKAISGKNVQICAEGSTAAIKQVCEENAQSILEADAA